MHMFQFLDMSSFSIASVLTIMCSFHYDLQGAVFTSLRRLGQPMRCEPSFLQRHLSQPSGENEQQAPVLVALHTLPLSTDEMTAMCSIEAREKEARR